MDGTGVVGRDEELGLIEAFVADLERGPSALVLAGEAGIGKTILWKAGVEGALSGSVRVLICRGFEAEASLSFSGLSELLTSVLEEVLPALASPRRRALEVALLLVEPGEVTPDVHAIGLAVLDVVRFLAQRGPVMVAVDDMQWLDGASSAALQVALRRLREEPVGVLATVRDASGVSVPIELERCFTGERLGRCSVGPLSLRALHHLLKDKLALDLTRPEVVRLHMATGGNPFFALELGRELVRTNARSTGGRALRVPESLRGLLGGRLARLPTDTGDVLLQVAALARPTVDLVAAAHGDRERVLAALDVAVGEGVVELDDSRVRFSHPLHGSVCYERAPLWKRRAVHRALAAVVTDVEERARHLALAADGPDAAVAFELEAAAEHAAARGASTSGAELCELAAELTPDDPVLARRRRLRAATFHRQAGDRERAAASLVQLLVEVPSGVERADVLFELALAHLADCPTMIAFCEQALVEATGDDVRTTRLLAYRSFAHILGGDVRRARLDARAALETAERVGDPALVAVAIARVGQAETYTAEITPGLLERGVEIEDRLGLSLEYYESPRVALARLQMRLGEADAARANLEELAARAMARGDEVSRGQLLWGLSVVEWMAGRLGTALDHATEAHELYEQTLRTGGLSMVGRVKALIEVDLGLVEQARGSAEEGVAAAQAMSHEYFGIAGLGVLGRLELVLGNLAAAGSCLRELPVRLPSLGINDPAVPVWADAIEALIALGELEPARACLENYEAHARSLQGPWAMAAAARCRGLLAAAEGDVTGGVVAFEHALATLEGCEYPFERGRTLLCLGSVRRQAQQKGAASLALEEAVEIFEDLGARLWADKARGELRRISGRRTASEQLTESERQVAALAGQGLTNTDIAAAMFMGVSTVEAHLSRVYRKLGVRRAELAARLTTMSDHAAHSEGRGPNIGSLPGLDSAP
jgi:DNA-binding CsgD family transcriptional regulator